ncbi:MAG: hypothetical protein RIB67_00100 [Miltoncostaeaceae bacterium]
MLDTETTIDPTQRLLVGVWRLYRDEAGADHPAFLVQEGILIPDDLASTDPDAHALVAQYVAAHRSDVARAAYRRLALLTRSQFVDQLLWRRAYKQRALVVGLNLPFDLSRLAVGAGAAKGWFRGGFSLPLCEHDGRENRFRPRLLMRMIDSKRAELSFSRPAGIDRADQVPEDSPDGRADPRYAFRGNFLDLRTLAFALTNASHSLESASDAFGVPYHKRDAPLGVISTELIDYCREDVAATASLCQAALTEYRRHPISRPVTSVRSPATLAKGYLDTMGLQAPLVRQPDLDPQLLGKGMAAYYGGRAECRIRRVPVPVVLCDFLSMYPTVNALMGSWQLLAAERIETVDATAEVRRLLASLDLERCFERELWRELLVLVEIEPAGEPLPVRARYRDPAGEWGIGLNHLHSTGSSWYTLADCVTAKILGGTAPKVHRALRLIPVGAQSGLKPVRLRGAVNIDPRSEDFFRSVIEERHRVRRGAGEYAALSDPEREALQAFLKVLANSGGYGIYAELNAQEASGKAHTVEVFGQTDEPLTATVARPETPGAFCFPPLAACITGAARLMLGMLEASVREVGGHYALCDTDSLAIVAQHERGLVPCPGGTEMLDGTAAITALSWARVEEIRDRFAALNPYAPDAVPGSILKIEGDNFDPGTHTQRPLWAYAISAKRYVLFTREPDGSVAICKPSEHGLGHLLNPTDPEDADRAWIHQAWRHLLARDGIPSGPQGNPPDPDWLDRPALSRVTVSSPSIHRLFAAWGSGRDYSQQIKPANFLLAAQVTAFGHPAGVDPARFLLIAPYSGDPRAWPSLGWRNRFDPKSPNYAIRTGDPTEWVGERVVTVKSYRQVLDAYLAHPEAKATGPDGAGSGPAARGLLGRRSVCPATISHIGKESNRLDDVQHGLVLDGSEIESTYTVRSRRFGQVWDDIVLPVLGAIPLAQLMETTSMSASALKEIRAGRARPRPGATGRLAAAAGRFARDACAGSDDALGDIESCARYLDTRPHQRCLQCGTALSGRPKTYCGSRCRQRAYRTRSSLGEGSANCRQPFVAGASDASEMITDHDAFAPGH